MNLKNKLSYYYNHSTLVEKLIAINIFTFLFTYLLGIFETNGNFQTNIVYQWFSLPTQINDFFFKPWTILSYGFLHSNFIHLLFNSISLYYLGNLFLDYFSPKKLLSFYLGGTLIGGFVFLTCYTFIPTLQQTNTLLVGASAAIVALLMGLATYMPHYAFHIRFIGFVTLKTFAFLSIAYFIVALLVLQENIGGHLAHLGGALFGYLAIRFKNIAFKKPTKKSKLKVVKKSTSKQNFSKNIGTQEKINAILDKIGKSGYDSLSKDEKEFLFQQGKN